MYITAKVIADSVANGHRVTTLELEYPRYIHSELMTHRVFSRNAASSRAIPFDKMLQTITSMDQTPKWTLNQKGMVGIPATTLEDHCYDSMFYNCTSLQVYSSSGTGHTKAWRIPTSGSASSYTSQSNMFYNCPGSYTTKTRVSLNTTFYTQNTPV